MVKQALTGLDSLGGGRERALSCCQKALCSGNEVPPLDSWPRPWEDVLEAGSEERRKELGWESSC